MAAKFPYKFLRSSFVPFVTAEESFAYRMKITYEFWGFCVNGGNDLLNPNGFATTTPFNFPTGFESGSLLASGSDGETQLATQFFSSSAGVFTDSHLGKQLVTWISGSSSTDDSIYTITEVINSGVLRVDTSEGGTPLTSSNFEPWFTDRTGINFRVVDMQATAVSSFPSGSYMVLEFSNEVNVGQVRPQLKIGYNTNGLSLHEFHFHMSPSGSWNGSGFTDGQEIDFDTGNSNGWTVNGFDGAGRITMIADPAFLFHHGMGVAGSGLAGWHDNSAGWYVEVPDRIYPQEVDPNPFVLISWGGGMRTTSTLLGWGQARMIGRNGVEDRFYQTMARAPTGLRWDGRSFGGYPGSVNLDQLNVCYNKFTNRMLMSEVVLARTASDEYTLARTRLRNYRAMPKILPDYQLIGDEDGNQWFNVFEYVWLPWDGAHLPRNFVEEF